MFQIQSGNDDRGRRVLAGPKHKERVTNAIRKAIIISVRLMRTDALHSLKPGCLHRTGLKAIFFSSRLSIDARKSPPVDADNSKAGQSRVAILLFTYQGQNYLSEQLESFAAQTHPHWEVWASDDGSGDDKRAILEAY